MLKRTIFGENTRLATRLLVMVGTLLLVVTACASGGGAATAPVAAEPGTSQVSAPGTEHAPETEPDTDAYDPGSATLTIGEQVWEFDEFLCVFGHEATESDVYSFTTNSSGEFDGVRVQMQATISEKYGHEITFNDISDFENPSIDWHMRDGSITAAGDEVSADGPFDDELTEGEREATPGTLEATCGDQSRR